MTQRTEVLRITDIPIYREIDDDALIEALITKKVFAAGLDVFDHEPERNRVC